jgi:hypothetical protein
MINSRHASVQSSTQMSNYPYGGRSAVYTQLYTSGLRRWFVSGACLRILRQSYKQQNALNCPLTHSYTTISIAGTSACKLTCALYSCSLIRFRPFPDYKTIMVV